MNGVFPEWLNTNSGRAFPLSENALRTDITGSIKLPDSLIVAAQISMTPDYVGGTFYVSQVGGFHDRVTIEVSYMDQSAESRKIAVITALAATHSENQTYTFTGTGSDAVLLGSLTIGSLVKTVDTVPGLVLFEPSSTPFEVAALMVSTPALKSIDLYNGDVLVQSYTNLLKLRAGENIRLTRIDEVTIRIDAISGENLVQPDACANAVPKPPCIRTINGVPPDSNGNFNLDGGECLSVVVAAGSIELTDNCATSCCGCEELQTLVAGLTSMEAQIQSLRENAVETIHQQVTMIATLAANV